MLTSNDSATDTEEATKFYIRKLLLVLYFVSKYLKLNWNGMQSSTIVNGVGIMVTVSFRKYKSGVFTK